MNRNEPLVSICCITYNHENYIRDCIEGFLMQKTTFPIEIIIHDDASTDNTAQIIKEYADQNPDLFVTILQTENQWSKGGGSIFARFVFPRARGKYIALCEGDDYWTDSYKLQKQVYFLEENPDYGIASSRFVAHDKNDVYTGIFELTEYDSHVFFAMQKKPIVATLTSVIRKDAIYPLLQRIKNKNLWFIMDIWFWQLISLNWKIHVMDDVTAVYRDHEGGITKRRDGTLGKMEPLLRLDVYNTFFREHSFSISFMNKWVISKIFIGAYIRILRKNLSPEYAKIGSKLLVKKPWLLMGVFPFTMHQFYKLSSRLGKVNARKKHNTKA
jgi:glycosyltransferase involved in cell wall biosynthesis